MYILLQEHQNSARSSPATEKRDRRNEVVRLEFNILYLTPNGYIGPQKCCDFLFNAEFRWPCISVWSLRYSSISSTGDVKSRNDSLDGTEQEIIPGIITKKRGSAFEGKKTRLYE